MKKTISFMVSLGVFAVILFLVILAQVGAEFLFEGTVTVGPVKNFVSVLLSLYIDRDVCNILSKYAKNS